MKTLSDMSRFDLEMRYTDLVIRLQDAESTIEYLNEEKYKLEVELYKLRAYAKEATADAGMNGGWTCVTPRQKTTDEVEAANG